MDVARALGVRTWLPLARTVGVAVVLSSAGCVESFPKLVHERHVPTERTVRLDGLPSGTRVLLAVGKTARVLAVATAGSATVSIPGLVAERIENGVVTRTTDVPNDVTVVLEAPEHMPQRLALRVPAPAPVKVVMVRPALRAVERGSLDAALVDRVLHAAITGRCAEAKRLLDESSAAAFDSVLEECAARSARRTTGAVNADWDVDGFGIPRDLAASPRQVVEGLAVRIRAGGDDVRYVALQEIGRRVAEGRLNDAARLASLVAEPLSPKQAALVLTLPAALVAERRLIAAADALDRHDTRAAFELASDALVAAPVVAARGFAHVRARRVAALVEAARAHEADGAEIVAHGYWLAVSALDAANADVKQGLDRTMRAVGARAETHLDVVANDESTGTDLAARLDKLTPRHVVVATPSHGGPDGVVTVTLGAPARHFAVSVVTRTKPVLAFRATKPNPAYDDAKHELAEAEHDRGDAQQNYEELHRAAKEMAQRSGGGGLAGAVAAAAAGTEEVTGLALLKQADARLAKARRQLASTPRTITEDVMKDAAFRVVHVETVVRRTLSIALHGFGDVLEDTKERTATLARDHVLASEEIGVEETPVSASELESVLPDMSGAAAELATSIATRVRERELEAARAAFERTRGGDPLAEAAAAAVYLYVAGDGASDAAQTRARLAEVLP